MKISIDNPCHENWDAMTPNEQGAFCLSCQKTVVDFSTRSLNEIKAFFKELPLTEKVCGRFASKQLEAMTFDDFFKRFRRWNLLHKIAVVCFFTFGLGLFSCTPGSSEVMGEANAHRGTIQTQDTLARTDMTMGEPEMTPDTTTIMAKPVVPQDTTRKHAVKKAPAPVDEHIQMIQGDVMVDPEPVIHTKGEVVLRIEDLQQPVKCAPKDSLKEKEPEQIMGKIKLNP